MENNGAFFDFDDMVFKSCLVQTPPPLVNDGGVTFGGAGDSSTGQLIQPDSRIRYQQARTFSVDVQNEPPIQPGAGICTSPMTVNVDSSILDEVTATIEAVLKVARMPYKTQHAKFKYSVAVYFTSGFARFTVRIWRRNCDSGHWKYSIEVMRDRGDRILVLRFFEILSGALKDASVIDRIGKDFHVNLFDWAPKKLPDDIIAMLPSPSREAVESGISSMISMSMSLYDDVAVNGCASVAKLAAASSRTRSNMAGTTALLDALLGVIGGNLSIDTRTNAAMALAELAEEEIARQYLAKLTNDATTVEVIFPVLEFCKPNVAVVLGVDEYEVLCLQSYCANIVALVFPSVEDSVMETLASYLRAFRSRVSSYMPLKLAMDRLFQCVPETVVRLEE